MTKNKKDIKRRTFREYIISNDYAILVSFIRVIWYIVLVVIGAIYLFHNWDSTLKINIFNKLSGDIIIFLVWLALLIAPFIQGVHVLGIKLDVSENPLNKISRDASADALSGIEKDNFEDAKAKIDEAIKDLSEERGDG